MKNSALELDFSKADDVVSQWCGKGVVYTIKAFIKAISVPFYPEA